MQAFAVLAEPPLLFAAERWGKRQLFLRGGLFTIAAVCALVAAAPAWWVLLIALSLFGPASGVVNSLAQATLVDASGEHPERAMARWTLMGSLGDLAGPLLLAGIALFGLGWRAAYFAAALCALATALAWPRHASIPDHRASEEDDEGPRVPLREAARRPLLWALLLGVALCALLDEPLVAFGAIHLEQRFAMAPALRSLALGAWTLGSVLGSLLVERLVLRFRGTQLMVAFGAAAAVSTLVFAFSTTALTATAALFCIGVVGTGLFPLAKAQAYRALPGQSGLVVALESVLQPVELALPLLLGAALDAWGSAVALALLAVQPLYLAGLALIVARRTGTK
jgi:FSR family fosmidomycin resistance protein-like MFS transporter